MATEPTLEEVLSDVLDSRIADIHTALPGSVVRYDSSKQTADVQPMIRCAELDADGNVTTRSYPVLPSIPVAFPAAGGFAITFPVQAGDTGLLVFCELPIDRWRSTGQESHPADIRRHSTTAAVFYPGLRPTARAFTPANVAEDLTIGRSPNGPTIHLKPDGSVHLGESTATDFVALATLVDARLSTIVNAFNTHGHAAFDTAPSTLIPALASVAAKKVKAT